MNRKWLKLITATLILTILLLLTGVFSLCIGTVSIPFKNILYSFLNADESVQRSIIIDIRLPRILLGIAVGGSLSLAGVLLQGMFRNPLVEPYTLGISGGAALGVCLNIIFNLNQYIGALTLPLAGFIGALCVIILIYFLSMRKGIIKIQSLLLTGVMISFISSSIIMLLMSISRNDDLHGIIYWIMGSLEESNRSLIYTVLIVSLAGLVLTSFFSNKLNALSLGEEEAQHLGVNIERSKRILFIVSSLLTGLCVSVAGIIGFVGLVVPHFMRIIFGSDHRILLITAFLSGGIFLIFCDTIARTIISPLELPVGVITGIIGGFLFIFALSRKRMPL